MWLATALDGTHERAGAPWISVALIQSGGKPHALQNDRRPRLVDALIPKIDNPTPVLQSRPMAKPALGRGLGALMGGSSGKSPAPAPFCPHQRPDYDRDDSRQTCWRAGAARSCCANCPPALSSRAKISPRNRSKNWPTRSASRAFSSRP